MRTLIIIILTVLGCQNTFAQIRAVDVNINHVGSLPLEKGELISFGENIQATLINDTENLISIFLAIQIYKDGDLWVYTNPMYRGLQLDLEPGVPVAVDQNSFPEIGATTFLDQVNPAEFRDFSGISRLDPGSYEVCLVAYDANSTQNFQLSDAYPITCTLPIPVIQSVFPQGFFPEDCADVMDKDEPLEFFWDTGSLAGDLNEEVAYTLKVVNITGYVSSAYDHLFTSGAEVVIEERIDEQSITSNIITINPIEYNDLVIGNTYAWRIDATLPERVSISDEIYSSTEVMIFQYGNCEEYYFEDDEDGEGNDDDDNNNDDNIIPSYSCENCDKANENLDWNRPYSKQKVSKFTAGFFEVSLEEAKDYSNDSGISGEGETTISLFGTDVKMKIGFENVQLNHEGRMWSGKVAAMEEDMDEYMDQHFDFGDLESLIEDTDQYKNFRDGVRIIQQGVDWANNEAIGLPLGINQVIDGEKMSLLITNIAFNPEGTKLQAIFDIDLDGPNSADEVSESRYIAFGLSDICFTPEGFTNNLIVHLTRDIDLSESLGLDITLKGCGAKECKPEDVKTTSSFVEFGCNGVEGIGLRFAIDFSNEAIIEPYKSQHMLDKLRSLDEKENKGKTITDIFSEKEIQSMNSVTAEFGLLFGNKKRQYLNLNGTDFVVNDDGFDWMVNLAISPFQFSFMPDFGYSTTDAWLDLSVANNPPGMEFPKDHGAYGDMSSGSKGQSQLLSGWIGLYVKKAHLWLPESLGGANQLQVGIENLIYDLEGEGIVSVDYLAEDILRSEDFSVDNWGLSIDELRLKIVANNFSNTSLSGMIDTPFLHRDDDFSYTAKLYPDEDNKLGALFTINPGQEDPDDPDLVANTVRIPFLMARAELLRESHITIEYDRSKYPAQQGFNFSAALAGKIKINPEEIDNDQSNQQTENGVPLNEMPINMIGIPFMLKYTSQEGFKGSYFGLTSELVTQVKEGFASISQVIEDPEAAIADRLDQDRSDKNNSDIAGFKLNIHNVSFDYNKYRPSLTFEPRLIVMSGEDSRSGSTEDRNSFGIDTKVTISGKTENEKIVFDAVKIDCGGIDAQVKNVSFRGEVCFEQKEDYKQFTGKLAVQIGEIGAAMVGGFGTMNRGKPGEYPYWHLLAMYKDEVGKAIPNTPVSIYGIGGGVFYNCSSNQNIPGRAILATAPLENSEESIYTRIPIRRNKGDFQVNLLGIFGFSAKPDLVNFNLGLMYQLRDFKNTISIQTDAFALTNGMWKPETDLFETSFINAKGSINLIFEGGEEGTFIMEASVDAKAQVPYPRDKALITADAPVHILLNTRERHFHVYVGVPDGYTGDAPISGPVEISARFGKKRSDSDDGDESGGRIAGYFMMGDGLPAKLSLPEPILNWHSRADDDGNNKVAASDGIATDGSLNNKSRPFNDGRGLALGALMSAGFSVEASDCFSLSIAGIMGCDLNMTHSETRDCGRNGWYASGQMYVGIKGALKLFCVNVADFSALAVLQGGFPDPTWASGEVTIKKKRLLQWDDNNIRYKYRSFSFSIGDQCTDLYHTESQPELELIQGFSMSDGQEDVNPISGEVSMYLTAPHGDAILYPRVKNENYVELRANMILGTYAIYEKEDYYANPYKRTTDLINYLEYERDNPRTPVFGGSYPHSDIIGRYGDNEVRIKYRNLKPNTSYIVKGFAKLVGRDGAYRGEVFETDGKLVEFKTGNFTMEDAAQFFVFEEFDVIQPNRLFVLDERSIKLRCTISFAGYLNNLGDISIQVLDGNGNIVANRSNVEFENRSMNAYSSASLRLSDFQRETVYFVSVKAGNKRVYSFRFRTSKFNTWEEKIASITLDKINGKNAAIFQEPFDEYEWNKYDLGLSEVLPQEIQNIVNNVRYKAMEIERDFSSYYVFPKMKMYSPQIGNIQSAKAYPENPGKAYVLNKLGTQVGSAILAFYPISDLDKLKNKGEIEKPFDVPVLSNSDFNLSIYQQGLLPTSNYFKAEYTGRYGDQPIGLGSLTNFKAAYQNFLVFNSEGNSRYPSFVSSPNNSSRYTLWNVYKKIDEEKGIKVKCDYILNAEHVIRVSDQQRLKVTYNEGSREITNYINP